MRLIYLYPVFGNSNKDWDHAFPVQSAQARGDAGIAALRLPPCLLMNVESDWGLQAHAADLGETLSRAGVFVEVRNVLGLNHLNTMTGIGRKGHRAAVVMDEAAEWAKGRRRGGRNDA